MTEATQTATPTDARQASMSRVQTQETVLAKLAPPAAASEQKPDEDLGANLQNNEDPKPKKTAQERIRELAHKNREAEAKADAERKRADELEARLNALNATAPAIKDEPRPTRSSFATEEEYEDALGDWRAKKILAQRELEQAQARAQAEQQEIAANWERRQAETMERIEDYAEVLGKSEVNVPAHVHQAILESDQGPEIAYYLALHPDEAKRIAAMRPIAAIKRLDELERDLKDLSDDEPQGKKKDDDKGSGSKPPQKSKAPPPVDPVRSAPSSGTATTGSFKDYKARRQADKRSG